MALAAATIFELNASATASNVNSGGFNPANANMLTDGTTDTNTGNTNSPVFSSASYNFVAGDVNHWLYIQSGTNWIAGWYQIASVASNKATLRAAIGQANIDTNRIMGTNTSAGVASVGTPTSGVWTIDYSRSTASPFASTDLASLTGTTNPATITSAANPFGGNMVGNLIHITAGTNWTAGWYEIVSVSVITATLDRAVGSAATLTSGTGKVGGALSLNTATDDAIVELATNSASAATRYFFKSGTFTLGGIVAASVGGNNLCFAGYEGYYSIRGDRPSINSGNQPIIVCGANTWTSGPLSVTRNITFTGTTSTVMGAGAVSKVIDCKCVNNSTTANRSAFTCNSSSVSFINCEGVSIRGNAFQLSGTHALAYGCYAHDSDNGIQLNNTATSHAISNVVMGCVTAAINCSDTGATGVNLVLNNTLYGHENKLGIGVKMAANHRSEYICNNIIYGFATGISHASTNALDSIGDYNDFYNNTADVSNYVKTANDKALDPTFTGVSQVTVTSATSSNTGNTLVKAGATFITSGVTAGRDYCYISAGGTVGTYEIVSVDSETQLTLGQAPSNASGTVSAQITVGRDLTIGTNLKALGFPNSFVKGGTSYMDIGALQRQEAGGSASAFMIGGLGI